MRIIKFRAFCKLCGCFRSDFMLGEYLDSDKGAKAAHFFMEDGQEKIHFDLELSQFTGLHDRNGKEIYEGDIVKCEAGAYEIVWDFHHVAFIGKGKDASRWMNYFRGYGGLPGGGASNAEVIGNVYEDRKLLKSAEEIT